jgi:hypothetical protein
MFEADSATDLWKITHEVIRSTYLESLFRGLGGIDAGADEGGGHLMINKYMENNPESMVEALNLKLQGEITEGKISLGPGREVSLT